VASHRVANGVPSQRVDDYFSFALANGGYPMHTSAVLFRREQLIDCGLFALGKSMGEDIDMWCRLAFRGSFQYVARPLGQWGFQLARQMRAGE
jgi:hypothetical protein